MKRFIFLVLVVLLSVSSAFAAIKLRRDTAANWTSNNPTLESGEQGYETDTKKMKIGDGSTAWTSLTYATAPDTDLSGTATLGTAEIADGACATVVTVSATGVATTDVIDPGYQGTPVGTTGYDPTAASLSIIPYPTANNVNFLVCNTTGAAVTPGAMTINWRVDR